MTLGSALGRIQVQFLLSHLQGFLIGLWDGVMQKALSSGVLGCKVPYLTSHLFIPFGFSDHLHGVEACDYLALVFNTFTA